MALETWIWSGIWGMALRICCTWSEHECFIYGSDLGFKNEEEELIEFEESPRVMDWMERLGERVVNEADICVSINYELSLDTTLPHSTTSI